MDVSMIVSLVSAVIATTALAVAMHTARSTRRSADADEANLALEKARHQVELAQLHEKLGPDALPAIKCTVQGKAPHRSLVGEISLPRSYRADVTSQAGVASMPISGLPLLVEANHTYRLHIEPWSSGQEKPRVDSVRLKLWPPVADVDDTPPWTCPCGRPIQGDRTEPGHWDVVIPIEYVRPPRIRGF